MGTNLIDFLNTNFSNFDEYFVWFTKFFTSYIKYFEKSDIDNLKIDKTYSYSEIENLGKKYFKLIKKDAIKVQKIYFAEVVAVSVAASVTAVVAFAESSPFV